MQKGATTVDFVHGFRFQVSLGFRPEASLWERMFMSDRR